VLFLVFGLLVGAVVTRSLWLPALQESPWEVVYDGYGEVDADGGDVSMAPMTATVPTATHACLVSSRQSYGDLTLTAEVRTVEQLRDGEPNPWEVGWLLWHYTDPQHFYAVVLKPNGWEISKQVPGAPGGQMFLASGHTPTFAVGEWHSIRVTHHGGDATVWGDGVELGSFSDPEPYQTGSVALYTEDAHVLFRDVEIETEGL
jgi:3-keto-disaccharide hydrolase